MGPISPPCPCQIHQGPEVSSAGAFRSYPRQPWSLLKMQLLWPLFILTLCSHFLSPDSKPNYFLLCYCVASVVSDSVQPHRQQPTRLPRPWASLGKNTGVGCHFLLQCMKVRSKSEVTQSCPTLSNPMDCSLPGSSVHGIFQARVLEWVAIAFSQRL